MMDSHTYDALLAQTRDALGTKTVTQQEARMLIKKLSSYREFGLVTELAEKCSQTLPDDSTILKAYAQALIEQGKPTLARDMLQALLARINENDREWDDLHGVLGRAYKDIFFVTHAAGHIDAANRGAKLSYEAYALPFQRDRVKNYYHGINIVALLRAFRVLDIDYQPQEDERALARKILDNLNRIEKPDVWAQATKVEAGIALGDWDEAEGHLRAYLNHADIDAFKLFSTLRQLRDVWKIGEQHERGRNILRMLEAASLRHNHASGSAADGTVLQTFASHIRDNISEDTDVTESQLEKVFGKDGLVTYRWFKRGLSCASSVACVLDASGKRIGTAFAIDPGKLGLPSCADSSIALMTNYHVLNAHGYRDALMPEEARIRFDVYSDQLYKVGEILFEEAADRYGPDVTVFCLKAGPDGLEPLEVELEILPDPKRQKRVYAIGHPLGGEMQLSLHDNHLLDHDGKSECNTAENGIVRLHYFTPTEPGSSGSPVFNDAWECIALHHAGAIHNPPKSSGLKRLNGQPGRYSANEGIWLGSIKARIEAALKS